MNQIQKSLGLNALFSSTSGIAGIILHQKLAELFGLTDGTVFWVTGLALLFFSSTIVIEIFKQRPLPILWIITQDYLWVLGSIILILLDPFQISDFGNYTIGLVACIVFIMGVAQSKALAKVDSGGKQKGMKQFRFERTVKATKQEVWQMIADVANYDQVAPNIDHVQVISGKGKGMVRSCSHGKDSWTETCSLWEEEKIYSFEVNTGASDYPYPFKFLKGTWEVQEMSDTHTKIVMIFDFRYKQKFQSWLLHPLFKNKFLKVVEALLDNWQRKLEIEFIAKAV